MCTPVVGGAEGAYTCTSENIGATVITFITLDLVGKVPLDWPAYYNYTTNFYNKVRESIATVAGKDFDKSKIEMVWSAPEHTMYTSYSSPRVVIDDRVTYKVEVGNRILKDKLQADTTTVVLNKMLAWESGAADVTVSQLTFSDSRPGKPSGEKIVTKSEMEAGIDRFAREVCECVLVCV